MLAYHCVGTPRGPDPHNLFVSQEAFAAQMRFLARRRHVVALDEIVAGTAPRSSVAITFDDGYRHLLTSALPVLEAHGFPATVFVPSAYLGRRNEWDAPSDNDLAIMDAAELQEADRRGLRVESHGHEHLDCRDAAAEVVARDLSASVEHLQRVLQRRPALLAWPYKDGSPAARAEAAELGFRAAFSIDQQHEGRYSWERVQVTPRDGVRLYALKTSGRYMQLRHARVLDLAYRALKHLVRR